MLAFDVPMEPDLPDDDERLPAVNDWLSAVGEPVPDIDDRLVAEECPYEIYDGVLVPVAPAGPLHAECHVDVGTLLKIHVRSGFTVACEKLIRTDETSDIAPDVTVYPRDPDPQTGGRQIEQLAFEVCVSETLGHAARKAAKLIRRGVRRVFAIDVKRERVFEWSRELGAWQLLERDSLLEDQVLATPLPVRTLLEGAKIDDAVQQALILKGNRVFRAAMEECQAAGRLEGQAKMLITILTQRGLSLDDDARARILGERDLEQLGRWAMRALSCNTVNELLAEP